MWTEYQHQILGYECPIKNVTGNVNIHIENEDGTQEQNLPFTFEEGQFLSDNEKLQDNGILKKWKQVTFSGTTITLEDAKSNGAYFCNKKVSGNLVEKTLTFDEEVTDAIIQYELAEEEIIPYNETQQEQYNNFKNTYTYKDITYISGSSDELAPELTIQYWKKKGGERSMKLSKDDLKKKLDERIEDEDLKIELLEDVEDSFEEVVEDTVERVEKTMYDELETKYDELKTKYKERFLSSEEVKEETTEEKDEGLTEEVVYEKEDIFEDTKKEED